MSAVGREVGFLSTVPQTHSPFLEPLPYTLLYKGPELTGHERAHTGLTFSSDLSDRGPVFEGRALLSLFVEQGHNSAWPVTHCRTRLVFKTEFLPQSWCAVITSVTHHTQIKG